ncbi:MAG: copper ion binding protein [Bacillales bacterium]|jgi:copper chaperone|nr:copper ion binding protein [Bacillales bacterium]
MKKKMVIEGMSCKKCVAHVTEALEEVGSTEIEIDLIGKTATFVATESVTDSELKEAVEDFGYDVVSVENA